MKRIVLLCVLVLISGLGQAQQKATTRVVIGTRTVKMGQSNEEFILALPIINPKYPKLKAVLNDKALLYDKTAEQTRKSFKAGESGITSFSYEVTHQDAKILSLVLNYETMGAYPSSATTFVTYNVATGKAYSLSAELSKEGLDQLFKQLKDSLNAGAAELRDDSLISAEEKAGVVDDYQERVDSVKPDEILNNYVFTKEGIRFTIGDFLPHVTHALEPEHDWLIPYAAIRRYRLPGAKVIK